MNQTNLSDMRDEDSNTALLWDVIMHIVPCSGIQCNGVACIANEEEHVLISGGTEDGVRAKEYVPQLLVAV